MVESEKTAQSIPRNTGPRLSALAVVCNGLLFMIVSDGSDSDAQRRQDWGPH